MRGSPDIVGLQRTTVLDKSLILESNSRQGVFYNPFDLGTTQGLRSICEGSDNGPTCYMAAGNLSVSRILLVLLSTQGAEPQRGKGLSMILLGCS